MIKKTVASIAFFLGAIILPSLASAHGVIGQRFFVESVTVLDPFPSDEMDLLAISHTKNNDGSSTTEFSGGIAKRLSPNLDLGFAWTYDRDSNPSASGFRDLNIALKYTMVRSPEHEFLATAAVEWAVGGTGAASIVGDSHSSLQPEILFGYGLGDLPDALGYIRPFGITGQLGINSPVGNAATNTSALAYGLVVEYSILYLQSFVKDVGISWPFNRIVPMVEFAGSSPLNGPPGPASLTAFPGLTWAGHYYQMTIEAISPINAASGVHPGVQALLHLYLDDMFPRTYTWTPFYGVLGPTQK